MDTMGMLVMHRHHQQGEILLLLLWAILILLGEMDSWGMLVLL